MVNMRCTSKALTLHFAQGMRHVELYVIHCFRHPGSPSPSKPPRNIPLRDCLAISHGRIYAARQSIYCTDTAGVTLGVATSTCPAYAHVSMYILFVCFYVYLYFYLYLSVCKSKPNQAKPVLKSPYLTTHLPLSSLHSLSLTPKHPKDQLALC